MREAHDLRDKVDQLADGMQKTIAAVMYEQDQRNEARNAAQALADLRGDVEQVRKAAENAAALNVRVEGLEREFRSLNGNVMSLLEKVAAEVGRREEVTKQWERTLTLVGELNVKMSTVTSTVDGFSRDLAGMGQRFATDVGKVEKRLTDYESRLTEVEAKQREDRAIDKTREKMTIGEKLQLVGGGVGGGGAVVAIVEALRHAFG